VQPSLLSNLFISHFVFPSVLIRTCDVLLPVISSVWLEVVMALHHTVVFMWFPQFAGFSRAEWLAQRPTPLRGLTVFCRAFTSLRSMLFVLLYCVAENTGIVLVFLDHFNRYKQTTMTTCVIWWLKGCLLTDWPKLIKYYLVTKVFMTVIRSMSKIKNLSISSELFCILMREICIVRKTVI